MRYEEAGSVVGPAFSVESCRVTAATTSGPGGLQRQPLEMSFACVLGTIGAFGFRQLAVGVDLELEFVEHCLACVGSSGGSVFSVRPRFVSGDLCSE
jgi:hypothetical protein